MYKTRVMVFLGIIAVVMVTLAGRLGYLQLVRGDHYLLEARLSLQRTEVLPARRGQILDRKGRILAMDRPCYDFCLDYRFLTEDPAWIRSQIRRIARNQDLETAEARKVYQVRARNTWNLAQALSLRRGMDLGRTVQQIVRRVDAYRRAVGTDVREQREMHPVVPGLEERDAAEARGHLEDTIGSALRPSHKRWYPYEFATPDGRRVSTACHVIGRIGTVSAAEQQRLNLAADEADLLTRERMNYRGWDQIGKTGVEKCSESLLRGRRGYRLHYGPKILETVDAEPGRDVQLTIDIDLQKALTERMLRARQTGAIVVLDIPTRQVLALVSVPLYNLNNFGRNFRRLVEDEIGLPLLNRAVSRLYPPGSTVKPIVALAAMADGKIDEHTTYHCRGYLYRPGRFRCTGRHGDIEVVEAIQRSCNIYFYHVGEQLGAGRLVERYRMFGMGDKPGTGLPEERAGNLPTEARIRRRFGRGYTAGDARNLGIGQGLMGVSPLHITNAIATLADGGRFLSPKLLVGSGPEQVVSYQSIPKSYAELIRRAMWKVINQRGGTGYRRFANSYGQVLGFDCCGKSGTAEVPPQRIDSNGNGQIDGADRAVRSGNMAWFVGFAPYRNPRIAFAVVVEYTPGHGGSTAGPIAGDVVYECKKRGYLP
jgi:penicillin-binding protein 2